MLIAVQFPFTDVRAFLEESAPVIAAPSWGNLDPLRDFVRGVGPIRPRRKGAVTEWPEEDAFCRVSSALRFDPSYHAVQGEGLKALNLRRYCAFRRFMADGRFPDGSVVARLELGFGFRPRKGGREEVSAQTCIACVTSTLDLPVQIRANGPPRTVPLVGVRELFDDLYLRSTLKRTPGAPAPLSQRWWFRAGLPLVLVEFRADPWPPVLPTGAQKVPALNEPGLELAYLRLPVAGFLIGVWLLAIRPGVQLRELLRRLRTSLFRLHAERQSVAEVLRLVRQKKINSEKGASDKLQAFLHDAMRLLNQARRDGLPQSEILKASAQAEHFVHPSERPKLLQELEKVRPAVWRGVKEYLENQGVEPVGSPMTPTNKKVFISHSSQDKAFVRRLVEELQKHNLHVWFDEQEIAVGRSIVEEVSKGLANAEYLIVILSKASVSSSWVMEELNSALMEEISNKGIAVLPVLVEDCQIPPLLRSRLYADFRTDFHAGMKKLLAVFEQESTSAAQVSSGAPQLAAAPCSKALATLTIADLRRRMTKRMNRSEVGTIWFDLFSGQMDDDMPARPKGDCIIELLTRANSRNQLPQLIDALCQERPDLASP